VEPLVGALADPDPEVRACSAFALGQLGYERALPALSGLLGDPAFENRPYHTYPWGRGDTWDPRETYWDAVVHSSVGQIVAQAISEIRRRVGDRQERATPT
ncbi:MAG: HEAT repeat domain-containing protein, partial [bacterium]